MATLSFRKVRVSTAARTHGAIIDIGSNSIRLVVYAGPSRLPSIVYNEKILAGLGRGLSENGRISDESMKLAKPALARFAALCREMEVADLRCVATAAVRDAENGGDLLDAAKALGLNVELLSGEDEAQAAGNGVLCAIPDARGIVGDLGGGSLELVRVGDGSVHERASFPLGVLRIGKLRAKGKRTLEKRVATLIAEAGWSGAGKGVPLYMVGGSWRALARLDMHLTQYPLPVIHGYRMDRDAVERLRRTVAHISKGRLRAIPNLSSGRVATLGEAGALLSVLMEQLGTKEVIVSAFGLREGLFHQALPDEERERDPLLVMAHEEAQRLGRFPEHGDLLGDWIAPLFGDEDARHARLRHTACLLADVGWSANPEFRAERGLEIALHGNWVAIDGWGRALLGQALFTSLGGGMSSPEPLVQLAPYDDLERAKQWGLAIRLGQRWSGGVAGPLDRSRLERHDKSLILNVREADTALYSETVARRHKALAGAMNLEPGLKR
ncbi:Ppx/GppA family phosphatase [Stakelama sp. CBK3Z-3]|uniref:Ppx/GppA family phosphatase n=1 Tax=Stakelama flava TaxID=2860338 RepID=A0ABS6XL40_9SPHN|nr:Ppx/GppA family phosphatase [Stakelama flava]MBW4330929.1 Ppx/GppA family phosphatase [Stakelama flava]